MVGYINIVGEMTQVHRRNNKKYLSDNLERSNVTLFTFLKEGRYGENRVLTKQDSPSLLGIFTETIK